MYKLEAFFLCQASHKLYQQNVNSFEDKGWVLVITVMMLRTITYSVTTLLLSTL